MPCVWIICICRRIIAIGYWRDIVNKIDEAREILKMLGMPKAQQANICCYALLAMAGIKQDTEWVDAGNEWIFMLQKRK